MTKALVVYESLFGDGRTIARAIADGLSARLPVTVTAASDAPTTLGPEIGLLVVGAPNHVTGLPRPATREGANRDYGLSVDPAAGLREWLDEVRIEGPAIAAAAYDTRMDHPKLVTKLDHASRTEEKLLGRLHCRLVAPAEHFLVTSPEGPLVTGEEERARAWGATLGDQWEARLAAANG
ncbi:flavodoxin [Geodermatophilus sabuli]|uniref:Flavodoxin n=1 Tax=Geodermatophilus sabuli TaxID=1564158 RepID=A0A285EF25_9ACTN|nr:flavodoxin [Geodermatophilus sabuli]MBB3086693.1 hypothetical protein [Geodermatophilus sabuli]SNX97655.1 hypothetical protein SAMN06893097_10819 [Geodermatophilus sabuli]